MTRGAGPRAAWLQVGRGESGGAPAQVGEGRSGTRRADSLASWHAVESTGDRFKERHLEDFANLAVLLRPSDAIDRATLRDRRRMRSMIGLLEGRSAIVRRVAGGTEAIEMLREVLA